MTGTTGGDGRRGSVKQEPNGTWSFAVDVGTDGQRRQTRRRGFPSRRAAQAELTRTLSQLEQRIYVAPQRQTLSEFLTGTWLPAAQPTIKPGTFESYQRNVRVHVVDRPLGSRRLQQVEPSDLNRHYALLLTGDADHRALSPRSTVYVASILHRAFRDAVRWNALIRNPADAADPPRPGPKPELQLWTAEQLGTFLDTVADDHLAGAWWLLATTGMRRGEALGLRWADVDLDGAQLRIHRTLITTNVQRVGSPGYAWGTPKTAKGRRSVALDQETVDALRRHRDRQRQDKAALGPAYRDQDLVVATQTGGPVHPKSVSYEFMKAARRAGLPRIRLHDLRHTHATLALRAGIHPRVVQERLGHANVSVTLDTYSHVDMGMQAAAATLVADLVRANRPRR